MIYLRLHQARNEEIDPGASKGKQGNFAIVQKFRYNSEIFATIAISLRSEISLCRENFTCSEILCSLFLFCVQTTLFWLISVLPLL